ncbi:MAG: hypothetical protein WCI27_05890 [Candidatus Omnitrophota bacterium]
MTRFVTTLMRREFFIFVILPFFVWMAAFWGYLSGQKMIVVDAVSYYEHIGFFTDNIIRGVYPLWDPSWSDGAPYNFFLRRIGEANPFYWLNAGLKMIGIPQVHAYLFFLTFYYFLALTAFWLIARILFRNRLVAGGAFLLLLFSGWGSQLFFNYIIIIFVPFIWFFYFIFAFAREGKKYQFLGCIFTLAVSLSTYIPFFFLTIIALFTGLFFIFFFREMLSFLKRLVVFTIQNKGLAVMCGFFLFIACVPAVDFYHESQQGEFVLPGRHAGDDKTPVVAVAMKSVVVGDLLAQGYFDRTFMDHASLIRGEFFISYFFFLACLITLVTPLTRKIFFLLANIIILGLISLTEASPLYKFLYDHIFFFRIMRMVSYFFWLAVLPMAVILVMEQVRAFIRDYTGHRLLLFFVVPAHLAFGAWALTREGVSWTAWIAVAGSMAFFSVILLGCRNKNLLFGILALAVIVQPFQLAKYVVANGEVRRGEVGRYHADVVKDFGYSREFIPTLKTESKDPLIRSFRDSVYYATRWFTDVFTLVPSEDRLSFTANKLYLIDTAVAYTQADSVFYDRLASAWRNHENIVFLARQEVPDDALRTSSGGALKAEPVGPSHPFVKVVGFDVNTLSLKVQLDRPRFLLWNDNYHSGWHVYINGREDKVLRADYAFKGVWLPAGSHDVLFRFATPWRYAMGYMSMIIFAVFLVMILVAARREGFLTLREDL